MNEISVSYAECIVSLVPNAEFSMNDNDYSSIQWDSTNLTLPTEAEIQTKKIELENNLPIEILRRERDILLMESDKYALPDYPHSSETKRTEWLTYRQSLRDITTTQTPTLSLMGELQDVTWPNVPS